MNRVEVVLAHREEKVRRKRGVAYHLTVAFFTFAAPGTHECYLEVCEMVAKWYPERMVLSAEPAVPDAFWPWPRSQAEPA